MNQFKVHYEPTPNPSTLKFVSSQVFSDHSEDFPNVQSTDNSPLAQKIFGFPWTASLFIGPDFVSVTKQDWVDWEVLADPLAGLIEEHLNRGEAIFTQKLESQHEIDPNDPEIVKNIKMTLDREIRPVVAMDGGDIQFAKYEESTLYIQMRGSCSGCPSSTATLKEGIEVRMKELYPEIKEVVAI